MKHQIATNPEQSQRLIACGVNPDSADMAWKEDLTSIRLEVLNHPWIENLRNLHYSPAWSLSALLALLPTEIKEEISRFDEIQTYGLLIYPYMQGWQIDYQYYEDDECHCLKCVHGLDLIGACVKAIEWLTANGYTLNTK